MEQTLDTFQEDAIAFFEAAGGRVVYADPMGARKTGTTLAWLARRNTLDCTLIVAPGSVHGHWAREAARFYPDALVFHYRGTPKQRAAILAEFMDPSPEAEYFRPAVLICSYAILTKDVAELLTLPWNNIVFDEAHRLKGRRTQVALAANKVSKRVPHVVLATGTPIMNHPSELWQYLHLLNPSAYPSFWKWVDRFFYVELKQFRGQRQATRVIHGFKPDMEDVLRAGISGKLIQRQIAELFTDHPWTAEPEHVEVAVELSNAERTEYERLVKHGWGRIGDSLILTESKLVVSTRLEQLTSDWGSMDPSAPNGSKVTAAIELIQDLRLRGPVVVFAHYKETVRRVAAGLSPHAASWTGDMDSDNKELILKNFGNTDGTGYDVIVGTLASLGEGVDGLQHHSHQIVMLDRSWVPALNDQAIGRLRRSGQTDRVTVWHLFAQNTIDEAIVEACIRKQAFADSLAGRTIRSVIYGRSAT